jgi:cytosine/adenosine deaminase-related metal-dependent hydrolase
MKEGFKADLIVVDVDVPNMRPLHDPVNGLIYSTDGKDVLMTMVDGEIVYRDGKLIIFYRIYHSAFSLYIIYLIISLKPLRVKAKREY